MGIESIKRSCIFQFMVVAVLSVPAAAQSLSFGVKGGTPITDPFVLASYPSSLNNYSFTKERYTVGPTFELGLPFNLAFEADALYKRLDYVSYPFGFTTFQAATAANSWEFPLLVKRRFFSGITRPFGDVGVSFRHIDGSTTFSNSSSSLSITQEPLELVNAWTTGFTAGGGADFGYGWIHISPELRYTRWPIQSFVSSNGVFASNRNSLDVIIGFTFVKD